MKLADILKKAAPVVAGLVGGPVGAGLGIVGKLAGILGQPEDASEEQLAQAVMNAPPEVILAIKQLESDTKVRLKELDLRPMELAAEDTNSARDMAKETGVQYQFNIFLILTVLVFLIIGALFYIAISELTLNQSLMSLLSMILGYVIKAWNDSTHFFNGTSLGSKIKDVIKPDVR